MVLCDEKWVHKWPMILRDCVVWWRVHAFILYHLSPTLANHKHTYNHVIPLVIYAATLHHTTQSRNIIGHLRTHSSSLNTIGQCLLYYNMSPTAVSLVFVCSWQRPSWPKRPAIIVIDSATYLLTISSPKNQQRSLCNIASVQLI